MRNLVTRSAILGLLAGASTAVAGTGAPRSCAALSVPGLLRQTTVTSALEVAADPASGTPAFCEVAATISPVPQSHIGAVFRLPADWNGKMLGLGGGGWAGNIRLEAAMPGLKRGYATLQTDGGHKSTTPFDTSWATAGSPEENAAALTDFSYRAVHLTTQVGKELLAKHYGQEPSRAYFQGCSTGGRQGLMEVQRFPADYNGVISGAPVYDLITQTTGLWRGLVLDPPAAQMSKPQLDRLNNAVLAACDAEDGLKDGIITDPRACHWDPGEVQCKEATSSEDCLSADQVEAMRKAYAGLETSSGEVVAYPASHGSELAWRMFSSLPGADKNGPGGLGGLREAMFGDPKFDLAGFKADDLALVMAQPFAKEYDANDPDLSAFTRNGGKLLMWHGFYDPGPSPLATIAYYERVEQKNGGEITDSARLFLAPGVYHCRGGPGPDEFDSLSALEQWVEQGRAPERIIATRKDAKMSRPLCPYPALPRYSGSGDSNEAASFICK